MTMQLCNAEKSYVAGKRKTKVFSNMDITIETGEMLAIMGRSGSGKSTLLHILSGLSKLTSGEYFFDGKPIHGMTLSELCFLRREHIGVVTQNNLLLDDRNVLNQVIMPLFQKRINKYKKEEMAMSVLKSLEMDEKASRYPSELSGGECQRVAIARALITKPQILIADEPTSALDIDTERAVMEIFDTLNKSGITIILATHDAALAERCSRIIAF